VIIVEQKKPETVEIATQMEPPEDNWILEGEVNEVKEVDAPDDNEA
jgi:hypothetical protein